jgi:hypothetical protein
MAQMGDTTASLTLAILPRQMTDAMASPCG